MNLSLIEKALLLKKTLLFAELDLDLLLPICDKMKLISKNGGEVLFSAGDAGGHMYLVVKGEIDLIGSDTQIKKLTGELFGEEALLSGEPRAYDARTAVAATLLVLSRSHLMMILSECPIVAITLLHEYATALSFRS